MVNYDVHVLTEIHKTVVQMFEYVNSDREYVAMVSGENV
jgi:hypothetical protein